MATVKFILSSKGEYPAVSMRLTISNAQKIQARIPGLLAFRSYWSDAKQVHTTRFVPPAQLPKVNDVNEKLSLVRSHVLSRFSEERPEHISASWLKTEADKVLHPDKYTPKKQLPLTLLAIFDEFISNGTSLIRKNGKPLAGGSLANYKTTRLHIRDFFSNAHIADLPLSELDKSFYERFVLYLYEKGYRPNSVGCDIKNIKSVIHTIPLSARGHCEFVDGKECVKIVEAVDNVYLTEDDLSKLAGHKFSSDILGRVRDEFILLSWTGCRYSDLISLTKKNIYMPEDGARYFKFEQKKTGVNVTIPILPPAERILMKYNYIMPRPMSNKTFNKNLQRACREAGIVNIVPVTVSKFVKTGSRGGEIVRTEIRKEKWNFVTAHTARRTFATNMYKRGFPTLMIMGLTGHKSEKAFLTYIKVTADENARRMLELFNKQENKSR